MAHAMVRTHTTAQPAPACLHNPCYFPNDLTCTMMLACTPDDLLCTQSTVRTATSWDLDQGPRVVSRPRAVESQLRAVACDRMLSAILPQSEFNTTTAVSAANKPWSPDTRRS